MRFVKENSTHAKVIRSRLKAQMKVSQKTVDFEREHLTMLEETVPISASQQDIVRIEVTMD